MPDSKDYLSTFKGIIDSLEKYITTDKWKNSINLESMGIDNYLEFY